MIGENVQAARAVWMSILKQLKSKMTRESNQIDDQSAAESGRNQKIIWETPIISFHRFWDGAHINQTN